MKIDTATAGRKYGIGKQMIEIHQHGKQEYDIGSFPAGTGIDTCNE